MTGACFAALISGQVGYVTAIIVVPPLLFVLGVILY